MTRGSGGGGTADGDGDSPERMNWNRLRWFGLCAALAALCLVWATVAADEVSELDELELVWSAQLTVGLTPAGQALPAPFSAPVDSYGYSSFVSMGALTPDSFQWRGETVAVHALGIEASGARSTLHLNVSTELADDFQLQVGEQRFVVSAADRPAGYGSSYRWTGVELSLTTGQTLTVGLARPYPPLMLVLSSSRELCTAGTLTELSWEISGGKPPYTLEIDGQTVHPAAESQSVNCGAIPTDPLTGEPAANPTQTFSALASDSHGEVATAEIWVALTTLSYPDETMSLRYQTHDPTGAAAAPGSYAFLTEDGPGEPAVSTYEALRDGTATELRINVSDAAGTSHADHYNSVAVADIIEWREADDCFVRYEVTAIEDEPPAASIKRFTIEWMTYAFTGCSGAIAADASVTMTFGSLPHLGGPGLIAPVVHGVYQIVPVGWTGPTRPVEPSEFTTSYPEVYTTTNLVEARQMRHWREISVPAGWRFRKAEEGGFRESPTDGYCAWYVTATGDRGLKVCGNKGSRIWFGAGESAWHNGNSVFETRIVAGRPASVIYSATDPYFPLTLWVYDAATQVEYNIFGYHKSLVGKQVDAVIAIAESLFAGSPPFGPATSASPTSSAARGTSQSPVLFEFEVLAGAPAGTTKAQTSGWHGLPSGADHDSTLDDGALDIGAMNRDTVRLLVETGHFTPSTPFDHVAGRVAEIVTPTDRNPKHYCARVEVDIYRYDGTDEVTLGRLYYVHVIPAVGVGERIILSGRGPISFQLGTVAAASWMDPVSFSQAHANKSWPMDDNVVQLQVIGNQTYKVMYTSLLGQWLEWRWPLGSTPPDNAEREECVTTGDHLHQGAHGPAVWLNKNSTALEGNDLPAYEDDGFGFDPDGDGYAAPERSFCSDTWLAKIRPLLAGPPLASPVSDCGAPDNAPVDLAAVPGHETLTLTWTAPALVVGEDDPITGYQMRWRQVTPTDTAWSDWAATDTTSRHELTALTNGNVYAAQVQAFNAGGVGPPSTVTAGPTALAAPTDVMLTVSGVDLSGSFEWTGSFPKFLRWELHRADDDSGTNSQVVSTRLTSTSPVEFNNQERGYWYRIRGRACARLADIERGERSAAPGQPFTPAIEVCGHDWSAWSEWLEISATIPMCELTTARLPAAGRTAAVCVPPAPSGVSSSVRTSQSLTIDWDDTAGATSYRVRMDEDDATIAPANDEAGIRTHVFSGLGAAEAFDIQVQAVRGTLSSVWSEPIEVYTLLPAPTIDTDRLTVTSESVALVWNEVEGADSYVVKRTDDPNEYSLSGMSNTSRLFGTLEASTLYTFSVRARLSTNEEITSAWTHHTETTLAPAIAELEITSATTTWQHCVKSVGRVPVDWTAEGGEPPYTTNGAAVDADTVTLLCPGTVGPGTVTLIVADDGSPARSDTADVDITVTEALSFELDDNALSCETDDTITIGWTLSGGTEDYTVTLPGGSTVTASAGAGSADYDCPSTAGTRTLAYGVVDASYPQQSDSDSLTVTITEPAPDPITIESAETTWDHCIAGEDAVPVDWSVSGGLPPYTVNGLPFGAAVNSGTVYVDCPARTGSRSLLLLVADASDATGDEFELVEITVANPISFSLDDDALSCETDETITIGWTLSGGTPGYTVTLPGGSTTSANPGGGSADYQCPSTAGARTLTFSVVDASNPLQRDSDRLVLSVSDPPLVFTLDDDYQSCEKGETIKLGWSLSGGQPPYEVGITGYALQRPSAGAGSVDFDCPNTAGERELRLTLSDSNALTPSIVRTQRVYVELPDYNFTARIRARLVAADLMEVCLQLSGTADCIFPQRRFFAPSALRLNVWTNSSMALADYDGDEDRTLGQISARRSSTDERIEFQFAACGLLDRIVPAPRFFDLSTATENVWRSTGWFSHTVMDDCASRSLRFPGEDSMTPAAGSESDTPGTDGGLMSE